MPNWEVSLTPGTSTDRTPWRKLMERLMAHVDVGTGVVVLGPVGTLKPPQDEERRRP